MAGAIRVVLLRAIHYEKYPQAVATLLEQVLAIQRNGDRAAADPFIER